MRKHGGLVLLAGLSGAIAVAAGAFGAHGMSGKAAEWLRTGGMYQLVHAAGALAALGLPRGRGAALLMLVGAGVFSGTLYAMAFGAPKWLGMVTPFGGAAMIGGWLLLALAGSRR